MKTQCRQAITVFLLGAIYFFGINIEAEMKAASISWLAWFVSI